MTLEEAQERIIELTEQNQELSTNIGTLTSDNERLTSENESLRSLNQKYFNKLIAQEKPEPGKNDDPEPESCEEFAAKLEL